jgi:hypothetical protein
MLALIPMSAVLAADFSQGHKSVTAISPTIQSTWRRFMNALLLALYAPAF